MAQRKLDIVITVSGSAAQAITGLRQQIQSLNVTTQQTAKSVQAASNAVSSTGQSAKTAGVKIDVLRATLQKIGTPQAIAALKNLDNSFGQIGVKGKQSAIAISEANQIISKFNKTAEAIGKGNGMVQLSSQAVATRNEFARMGETVGNIAAEVKRQIGSGAVVQPVLNQFNAQVQATKNALNEVRRMAAELTALNANKAAGVQQVGGVPINDAIAKATREAAAATKVYNAELAKLKGMQATMPGMAAKMRADAEAARQAGQASTAAAHDFKTLQQSIDESRRSAYAMTIAGFQLVLAGKAITGTLKESVSQFTEYDFSLRRAAGALNIFGDQTPMFVALSEGIQKVAIETKLFKPEEIAKGMYFWASATGEVASTTDDLNRVTAEVLPIMKAAAMTQTDLEASLKGVVGIIRQYHMSLSSAGDITEKLFLVTQKTAVEFPDLINSFKMVGPVAAAHNVTFEEMVRLFGAIGDAGIRGTMAGRAFRQMFIQLDKTSKVATTTLDGLVHSQLGLNKSFKEMVYPEGKFIGMAKYLNLLSDLTKGLTESERNHALAQITTANELGVMTELVRVNTQALAENKQGIFETTQSLQDAAPIFEQSWAQMANSAKAMFGELQARVSSAIYDVAKVLVESFRPIAKTIGDAAEAIHRFAQTNKELFTVVVQAVAATGALMTLGGSVLLLAGGIKLVLHAALPAFLADLAKIDTQATAATSSVRFLGSAISQLSASGAGMGGLSGGIGKAKGFFSSLLGGIGGSVGGVVSAIGRIAMIVKSAFIPATIVASAVTVALGVAFGVLNKSGQSFGNLLGSLGRIGSHFGSIIGSLTNIVGGFFTALFNVGKFIGEQLAPEINGAINTISAGIDVISGFLGSIGDQIGILTGDAQRAKELADSIAHANLNSPGQLAYDYLENSRLNRPDTKQWYDAGAAAGLAYADGLGDTIGGGPALDTVALASDSMMRGVVTSMVNGLRSGSPELRKATLDGVNLVIETWSKGFDEKNPMPASMSKMIESAKAMLASSNGTVNRMGQLFQAALAKGIQTGNLNSVMPAMRFGLDMAQKLIANKRPSVQREGYLMLASMARGMLANAEPGSAAAVQLATIIGALESGIPKLAAQGAKAAAAYLSSFAAPFEKTRTYTGGPNGFTILPDAVNPYEQIYKDIVSMIPKDSGGSGGGGGGGSKQPSPLEKALEVAKQGADLAEALAKVDGVDVKALVKQSMGGLAEAMVLADKITAGYAKGISKKTLQQVAEFSEATGKVASLIGSAAESFGKLKDYKRVGPGPMKVIAADLNDAVAAIESVAKHFKAKGLAAASLFADSASGVAKAIGDTFESMAKLGKDGYTRPPADVFDWVAADMALAVSAVGRAAETVKTTLLAKAKEFSDAGGNAVKAIGDTFESFSKISAYAGVAPSVIDDLVSDMFLTIEKVSAKAKEFNRKSEELDAISKFASTAGTVAKAIGDVFDAFRPRTQKTPGEGETLISPDLVTIFAQMDESLVGILAVAAKYDEKTLKQIDALAQTAGKVGDAIRTFFSIGADASKTGEGGQTMAGMIQAQLDLIMASVASFVASFKDTGASLIEQLVAGMKSQESALAAEVAQINAILGGSGGTSGSAISTQSNEMTIRHVVTSPDGSVSGMKASEVAALLNSGNTFISNLKQSAGTR